MDPATNPKQQIVEHLNQANNVLVTVSNNPTVDQLAACIGLALLLNKMDKHATAVFSGQIPSTIEFLKPEETIEKNTDSLRDFIIALDKSKADKLRYKVEDKLVKIFITPYRTSLSDKDLEFSQGDFNVDLVVVIGVQKKEELDQAITAHGRILHDATVASINTTAAADLGSINWSDAQSSSLCEMVTSIAESLKAELLDAQISTALLTGIVAETKRFSNEKTTSVTMSLSAKLMAAGANQQLVANELREPAEAAVKPVSSDKVKSKDATKGDSVDGSLQIEHSVVATPPEPAPELDDDNRDDVEQIHIDEHGVLHDSEKPAEEPKTEAPTSSATPPRLVLQPPTMGGKLTANSEPEGLDPSTDPLMPGIAQPTLTHSEPAKPDAPVMVPAPDLPPVTVAEEPVPPVMPAADQTLTQLEETVDSPHVADEPKTEGGLDEARSAVDQAISSSASPSLDPIEALNAHPVDLGKDVAASDTSLPPGLVPDTPPVDATSSPLDSPTPPPPVPPPIMPMS